MEARCSRCTVGREFTMKLVKKGAEAYLYLDEWLGVKVIKKVRVAKRYRVSPLDLYLRRHRTLNEARLLSAAKTVGVPAPAVLDVDLSNTTIVMEYIPGVLLKDVLDEMPDNWRKRIFSLIGECVGKLHANGIIHGDLTTSNMIVCGDKIFFIDFGLGMLSKEIEHFGVDVHLMLRALESTHYHLVNSCFDAFIEGYSRSFKKFDEVLKKVREIRLRGRYVVERRKRK